MNGEETELIVAAIEQIFAGRTGGHEFDGAALDGKAWQRLTEAGFSLVSVPKQAGGSGGTMQQAAAILRAVSRIALSVPLAESTWLAAWALAAAGVPVAGGPATATLVDDTDAELLGTAGRWRLNGVLPRVPWAADLDLIVAVLAAERPARIVLLNPKSVDLRTGYNLAGEPRVDVVCRDVLIDDACVAVADEVTAGAFRARAALSRVVAMSGAAEQALSLAVTQAQQREQFGRPIARFQAVQQLLARMAAETAVLIVSGQAAAEVLDAGSAEDAELAVAAAKAVASEAAGRIAAWGHQLVGAMGFTMEHPLQRSTRRLWAWRDEYGNERAHARSLADQALAGDPWSVIRHGAHR
jgi:acyl-CoA dehydrogenase